VATTKAQRKLFFKLRSMKKQLGWMSAQEVNEVANDLGVKPETVREMEMRLSTADAPFDGYDDADDEQHFAPAGYLEDHRYNPAQEQERTDWSSQSADTIHNALIKLDDRSQDIIRARWLDDSKLTLHDLADKYQISAERVRQLEKNAMQKLRVALEASER
jgi:RNA polymerase sigma-32 factor